LLTRDFSKSSSLIPKRYAAFESAELF